MAPTLKVIVAVGLVASTPFGLSLLRTETERPPDGSATVARREQVVRAFYERTLHDYTLASYRAYRANAEEGKRFLHGHRLRWSPHRENALGLPREVFAAYLYYVKTMSDTDLGSVRVFKVSVGGAITYAVRVTTDGDDGWLEVYDGRGNLLGAARTYIEVFAWGDCAWLRAQVARPSELPPALRDAHQRTLWGKPLPP